jgi:hypothetical protein
MMLEPRERGEHQVVGPPLGSPIPVQYISGYLPIFAANYYSEEPGGQAYGFGEPLGCRLCGTDPGVITDYLRMEPMSRPRNEEENLLAIFPPVDAVCICSKCVVDIIAMWERMGRPEEEYLNQRREFKLDLLSAPSGLHPKLPEVPA